MRTTDQLLLMDDNVLLLGSNGKTENLPQMVGTVAVLLYTDLIEYGRGKDEYDRELNEEQMSRLEKKIRLQSTALKSLSDACTATHETRV